MNRSWKNNSSGSSPGFVYFTPKKSQQNTPDTSDFLSFEDSPNAGSLRNSNFSPSSYSSPRKFNRKSGNFSLQNSYRSGGYARDFNQQYSSPQNNSYNNDYSSGYNNSYNNDGCNRSFNGNNYNSRQWKRNNGHRNKQKGFMNKSFEHNKSTSIYYDHSALTDPWTELEEQLKQKEEQEKLDKLNSVSSEDSSENESDTTEDESEVNSGEKSDDANSEEKSDENEEQDEVKEENKTEEIES